MMSAVQLEAVAEALVFAHEPDIPLPATSREQQELERAAVLATVAMAIQRPVPEGLQARLAADALAFCSQHAAAATEATRSKLSLVAGRSRSWPLVLLAAAAVLLCWLVIDAVLTGAPSFDRQRVALLATPGVTRVTWSPGPSTLSGSVRGDVVWSAERQQGFLTFTGLPALDDEHRFQLWIVDGQRDGAPVDGGLFAIENASAQTVVPIRAQLPIGEAAAFVVTVEDREGVVVSEQEHVVALAKP